MSVLLDIKHIKDNKDIKDSRTITLFVQLGPS